MPMLNAQAASISCAISSSESSYKSGTGNIHSGAIATVYVNNASISKRSLYSNLINYYSGETVGSVLGSVGTSSSSTCRPKQGTYYVELNPYGWGTSGCVGDGGARW